MLVDPVTEWKPVVAAAKQRGLYTIAVLLSPVEDRLRKFLPTPEKLEQEGVDSILDLQHRDVFACVQSIRLLLAEPRPLHLSIQGVIPLAETAVEFVDIIAAMLGIPYHNPLDMVVCKRDKGFMKEAVQQHGLQVAKFHRLSSVPELDDAMVQLGLQFPVVVKTPQGFSTTDVYICDDLSQAQTAIDTILHKVEPDGRLVRHALLEEYIDGTEFAVNLLAFCTSSSSNHHHPHQQKPAIIVTDVWKYTKTNQAQYTSADICNPHDAALKEVVSYAIEVAQAVGIRYGAGHVEIKAKEQPAKDGVYRHPILMEVGARLSGGQKATMTRAALKEGTWDPFGALIDCHCGRGTGPTEGDDDSPYSWPPSSFAPLHFARHVFLPIPRSGYLQRMEWDTTRLTTLHSCAWLVREGEPVTKTTDITTCAGFVWLVGSKREVEKDTNQLLSNFQLVITEQ